MLYQSKFHNKNIIEDHDFNVDDCNFWVDHYNFLANLSIYKTEPIAKTYINEIKQYLCYDV
jgi:hypothetical protein